MDVNCPVKFVDSIPPWASCIFIILDYLLEKDKVVCKWIIRNFLRVVVGLLTKIGNTCSI